METWAQRSEQGDFPQDSYVWKKQLAEMGVDGPAVEAFPRKNELISRPFLLTDWLENAEPFQMPKGVPITGEVAAHPKAQ
jgi:hypothetical protein